MLAVRACPWLTTRLIREQAEMEIDRAHTLILWPGESALTVEQFLAALPENSPWRERNQARRQSESAVAPVFEGARGDQQAATAETLGGTRLREMPILRVVVLDGVYRHAREYSRLYRVTRLTPAPPSPVTTLPALGSGVDTRVALSQLHDECCRHNVPPLDQARSLVRTASSAARRASPENTLRVQPRAARVRTGERTHDRQEQRPGGSSNQHGRGIRAIASSEL